MASNALRSFVLPALLPQYPHRYLHNRSHAKITAMALPGWLILLVCALLTTAALWWWQPAMLQQTWQQIDQTISGASTLYRWKDARGREQVSDTPPTDGTPFETLNYQHNVNIMPEHNPDDE